MLRQRRRVATGIGAVLLGLAALLFALAGDAAQALFGRVYAAHPFAPLLLTPALFAGVVQATRLIAPAARGSGIPQVIAAARDPDGKGMGALVSLRTAFAKVALTLAMLLGGGSVEREGPTVQLSAGIMVAVNRFFRLPIESGVLIAGGAAGVAAAFNTPLAGVAFAMEELAAAYEQRVAVLVMGAVMIAGLVSLGIAGDYVYFGAMGQTLSLHAILLVVSAAALGGGVSGGLFSRVVLAFAGAQRPLLQRLRARPVAFAAGCGLVAAAVGVASAGATRGTGMPPRARWSRGTASPSGSGRPSSWRRSPPR